MGVIGGFFGVLLGFFLVYFYSLCAFVDEFWLGYVIFLYDTTLMFVRWLHILRKSSRLSRTLRFLAILHINLPIPIPIPSPTTNPPLPTIIPTNTNQNIIKRKFPFTLFLNCSYNLTNS